MPATAAPMPRTAAWAGVLFALLYGGAVLLLRLALPDAIDRPGAWAARDPRALTLALQLLSFAAIAFLWFVGVVRTYLGAAEDRFLATVFLGSSLLFLAASLGAGAATGALLGAAAELRGQPLAGALHAYGGRLAYALQNEYALRMAGVCMFSLATLGRRSGTLPPLMVWGTYLVATALVLGLSQLLWLALVFPLWVLAVSVYLLRRLPRAPAAGPVGAARPGPLQPDRRHAQEDRP